MMLELNTRQLSIKLSSQEHDVCKQMAIVAEFKDIITIRGGGEQEACTEG